jgi:hypothetical protein
MGVRRGQFAVPSRRVLHHVPSITGQVCIIVNELPPNAPQPKNKKDPLDRSRKSSTSRESLSPNVFIIAAAIAAGTLPDAGALERQQETNPKRKDGT